MAHFDHATGREGRGGRKLIVCCDGTNNTLTGGVHDTNVLRLFTELRRLHDGAVLYYDPGVGAPDELPPTGIRQYLRRKWDRVAGLASGQGVFENIGEAYSFLVREYRAGDEIWLFGFSRGAFTARSVSGMVHLFGIVRPEHLVLLPTMLRVYFSSRKRRKRRARRHTGERRTRDVVAEQIRTTFTSPEGREAHVHFVGVWDTVESVGMPGMSLQISSSATIRGKRICHVRHALSLDEHRWPFLPRLYDEDDFGSPEDGQSLRQRWFRGVHSDVGGGYRQEEAGLADDALVWMVEEANACGLGCPPVATWQRPATARPRHDELYDTPWWALVGMTVRATDRPRRATAAHAAAAGSVWDQRRPARPLVVALVLGTLALAGSGFMLSPGDSSWRLLDPGSWQAALRTVVEFAGVQLLGVIDPDRPFAFAAVPGACPRRVMLFDLAFLACYAYVLARLCSRAFARLAGERDVGQPKPWWRVLGGVLPLLVTVDVVENALAIFAFTLGSATVGGHLAMRVGSVMSAVKVLALFGCAVLVAAGWLAPRRRQPSHVLPEPSAPQRAEV